ncbi:DUF3299 domain-containing protein [Photobacterium lutimaris]|nr:DUF3299 domain-containing protein [Photobacterium lutimaris]TDR77197.1 hypothetical protein DFP78_102206 [Photobacterium lutimaris]
MRQVITFIFLIMPLVAHAQLEITWLQLMPEMDSKISNPFSVLTRKQVDDLRVVARISEKPSPTKEQLELKSKLIDSLSEFDIDATEILKSREEMIAANVKRATSPTVELDDQFVKIAGFITPLAFTDNKVTEFFLVPSAGSCIHTPPPPPNQIIYVKTNDGFELESIHHPVWVTGQLQIENVNKTVEYSDGVSGVQSLYKLYEVSIEKYPLQ